MKYQNIIFHNISEMQFDDKTGAYSLLRFPLSSERNMQEQGKRMNRSMIGVELRFRIADEVRLRFISQEAEGVRAYLYYGNVQADWEKTYFTIGKEVKEIVIKKDPRHEYIERINNGKKGIFKSDIYRLVFDPGEVQFVSAEGQFLEIEEEKYVRYYCYGSSITSGSLTYIPQLSYPYLVAQKKGFDLYNIGFPGSCCLEKEVVDYLASAVDFEIMTIELGINVIAQYSEDEFQSKVHYLLTNIVHSHPYSKFYIIDIFPYFNELCGVSDEKLAKFRHIVKSETKKLKALNVTYIAAIKLMKTRFTLAADFVHPDIDGHLEIAKKLQKIIK